MRDDWFSYDDVAEAYAESAEPVYFAAPAEDLISLLELPPGVRFLDVGAGSGAATASAVRKARRGLFVACDLSFAMLLVARSKIAQLRGVMARLPDLPVAAETCGAVALGFVLSHIEQPVAALREVRRVLAVGGKVGVSSWSATAAASPAGELWQAHLERVVEPSDLSKAVARVVPSEADLSPDRLSALLTEAGFQDIIIHKREYPLHISADQFIQSRLLSAGSRYARAQLSAAKWEQFLTAISHAIDDRFGQQLEFTVAANIGIARSAG